MPVLPPHFSAHNCLLFNLWSSVTAAYLIFCMTHRVEDHFQIIACFHTGEQCSAINNLSIASALQLSKSGLCNSKLCVTLGNMQKVLQSYLSAFATMPFNLTMFRYDCIIANFAKGFSWISKVGTDWQGRNEVGWRPGQEASLAPPCSKLRSLGSKFTVLKKVLVTLLGLFGPPRGHSAPQSWLGARGIVPPRTFSLCPWALSQVLNLATIYVKILPALVCQKVFFTRHYNLLAYLNHLEISRISWDKNILCWCCLLTQPDHYKHTRKQFKLHQAI